MVSFEAIGKPCCKSSKGVGHGTIYVVFAGVVDFQRVAEVQYMN